MKITHVLDEVIELNTTVFAINSHVKGYNLCWHINRALAIDLKKQYNTKAAVSFFKSIARALLICQHKL